MGWRAHVNRLNGGLACCAAGLLIILLVVLPANGDLIAYRTAQPCQRGESSTDGCYVWLGGRVTAIAVQPGQNPNGPSTTFVTMTLALPVGTRSVEVAETRLPPGHPRLDDPVRAKLWRGQVTEVELGGATAGATTRPVGQLLLAAEAASALFLVGVVLLAAYAIDRRAGYV